MGLRFLAIDRQPATTTAQQYSSSDLLFQGWTVTEPALTAPHNVAAGELVRWLPRRQATDLALPGNDFWVFDSRLARINYFGGDGRILDQEVTEDPSIVKLCVSAFEAVWERALPHE